ncbi:hypothetical protein WDJ50_15600 [Deinococcus sp. VB142]|uniref:Uncharacterized protein n=1 Tax=Deinococcus sp. VB142 TaxID=3112952 RepID=A0AAU6Q7V6_9DEIO
MKRQVSVEQLQIAEELEEIAQKIRQGKWEMASFTSAEEGVDPRGCLAEMLNGTCAEDEDPEEVRRENLEFLRDFPMYAFFVNKRADPSASRVSMARWTVKKPEQEQEKQGKRMSPAQSRLAAVLGTDARQTDAFMRRVFQLAPKGTQLGKITEAAQSLIRHGDHSPTPERVAEVLKRVAASAAQPVQQETGRDKNKGRKHVSVWEIRN